MDILNTEDWYGDNLTFHETPPINQAFAFFGIDNKNFILNSGSYFALQLIVIGSILFQYFLNRLAVNHAAHKWARKLGIFVYKPDYNLLMKESTVKLFMESYFDLCICTFINLDAFV
jgi:hypothetical protein